jgi:two-component system, NarL family, sensor histidine kinase UhpB
LTLKLRLNLLITALLLLILSAGAFLSLNNAFQNARAEVKSTEKLVLYLFDTAILNNDKIGQGEIARNTFDLQRLNHMRHIKIELLDSNGIILDSNQSGNKEAQHEAPEWFESLANRLTSKWEPSVRTLEFEGKPIGRLVITPDPTYEYAEKWKYMSDLFKLVLVFFVLVNLVVIWAVAQALKPTERILYALNELEEGNFNTRLPRFKVPELAKIGEKFNRMIETLQSSIQKNHQLTHELITLQEQERKSLARDLHDEFGQCLTAIHTDASVILKTSEKKYPELQQSALAITQLSRHLIDMVSGLLQKLRPGILDELGLEAAIQDTVENWKNRHPNIQVSMAISGITKSLPETHSITIYRLIQECLTNITRHAHAKNVRIEMDQISQLGKAGLQVSIKDDGIGFDVKKTEGFGLPGMRERVEGLGGVLHIQSLTRNVGGTEITAWIPHSI